jgi:hypothetical protein
VNGFYNQVQSLLGAIIIAKKLERSLVVRGGFHVDYRGPIMVPLHKIFNMSTLSIGVQGHSGGFTLSKYADCFLPSNPVFDTLLARLRDAENNVDHLEIDCCFYLCDMSDPHYHRLCSEQIRFIS